MKLLAFFSLLVLGFCASRAPRDYRLDLAAAACTPRNCTSPGLLCESCTKLVMCLFNEQDDTWEKSTVETCNSTSYCVKGACVKQDEVADAYCQNVTEWPFICQTAGIFPDPFYRSKFVLCVQDTSTTFKPYVNQCEEGFGFNIKTDLCDELFENGQCPEEKDFPVPLCKFAGESAAFEEKPAMYYVCRERTVGSKTELYPYLDVCSGDKIYDNFSCVRNATTPNPNSTTTSSPPPSIS